MIMRAKHLDDWIPIKWHRVQTVPLDGSRYDSLREFFNAMVNEYKFKIENNIQLCYNILLTYHKNNYIQMVELFPTHKQFSMINRFVLAWCHKYKPKYLVRIHLVIDRVTKETGFWFMAEDLINFYERRFRIIKNGSSMELVERSRER